MPTGSRVREVRTHGAEGGAPQTDVVSLPLFYLAAMARAALAENAGPQCGPSTRRVRSLPFSGLVKKG